MNLPKLVLIGTLGIGPALADTPFTESVQLVLNAVSQGHTVQGRGRLGQTTFAAMAVPYQLEGDDCISIGLMRIASATIEDWRLCNGRLEQLPGRSPRLTPTASPEMAEAVRQTEQAAASTGGKLADWRDYRILARRLPEADVNGCTKVETLILIDGLMISRNVASICP